MSETPTPVEIVAAIPKKKKAAADPKRTEATMLLALVKYLKAELFHSETGDPFITVGVPNPKGADHPPHRITMSIKGSTFASWLAREFVISQKKMPSMEAITNAVRGLEGEARFKGPEHRVEIRVAARPSVVYVDLGHAIAVITPDGWSLVDSTDAVRFLRPQGFLPLPTPVQTDRLLPDLLATVLNATGDSLILITAWLVAACRGRKPFPILDVIGEQGSGKSVGCSTIRKCLDPNVAETRVLPKDARDLMIAALNNLILFFDNLTHLEEWIQNALCGLATGTGFATRALHTNTDEIIIKAAKPQLLNGISDVVGRADLLDRSLVVTLDPIPESDRKTETDLDARFAAVHAEILGSLFTAVACALKNEPTTVLERLPRMADFATTIVAACPSLGWTGDQFLSAYQANRSEAAKALLDGSLVGCAIRSFLYSQGPTWIGSATDLKTSLEGHNVELKENKFWPKSPKTLSGKLREVAPLLRSVGITIDQDRTKTSRVITLTNTNPHASQPTDAMLPLEPNAGNPAPGAKELRDDQIPF